MFNRNSTTQENEMADRIISFQAGFNAFGAIARGFAAWRQRRDRRLALVALLRMSPERLDDLGIDMLAVSEALYNGQSWVRAPQERVVQGIAPSDCTLALVGQVAAPAN
jgi:uncharacterized protein YjiS (DUF1127 family)